MSFQDSLYNVSNWMHDLSEYGVKLSENRRFQSIKDPSDRKVRPEITYKACQIEIRGGGIPDQGDTEKGAIIRYRGDPPCFPGEITSRPNISC